MTKLKAEVVRYGDRIDITVGDGGLSKRFTKGCTIYQLHDELAWLDDLGYEISFRVSRSGN